MAFNLFGNQAPQANKPLVEFRAGKMLFDSTTKGVTADKRKGLVQLTQSPQDSLIHFIWKDRTTGNVEDDLIIFPEEALYKKVKQSNGRVYLLEFKDSSRKMFFWMQEPKDDKDDEYVTKINQFINNPPVSDAMDTGSHSSEMGLDSNTLMQMLGNQSAQSPVTTQTPSTVTQPTTTANQSVTTAPAPTSTPTPATIPSTSTEMSSLDAEDEDDYDDDMAAALALSMGQAPPNPVSMETSAVAPAPVPTNQFPNLNLDVSMLQNILSGMGGNAYQRNQDSPSSLLGIALPHIMSPDNLMSVVLDPKVQEQLVEFLPDELRSNEEVIRTVHSPQLQQAVSTFAYALQSGQMNYIVNQLNVDQKELIRTLQDFAENHRVERANKKAKTDMDMS